MKKLVLTLLSSSAAIITFSGCGPDLAQVPLGEEEARWQNQINQSYPDFKAPRTPAPAAYQRGNKSETATTNLNNSANTINAPENDPSAEKPKSDSDKKIAQTPKNAAQEKKVDAQKSEEKVNDVYLDKSISGQPYTIQRGDTLSDIAQRFYGKSSMEDLLYRVNAQKIKDRHRLQPGVQIMIPQL